ncbi:MAG: hypothetical protein KAS15_01580 [Nanoarchaeota archaeon]|nr:hypothetical protein [Nanoarchaeota archaeon]MCK5629233.1 hypothetical protein [Nanoarchaeota archaeon]
MSLIEEEREKEELKKKEDEIYKNQEKAKRARLKNKLANEELKIELQKEKEKKEKEKQLKKSENKKDRIEIKKDEPQHQHKKQNKLIYFTKEEIEENEKLLFIYVNVKQIHAVEWFKGKKRVVLNKKREVRRTHAGGFSAEKFQKFIDAKKQKTFEWITEVLERQGVLRSSYNKIRISSQDDNLKKKLEEYLQNYLE